MAKNIVIVVLILVAACAGYLAYTSQTTRQSAETELAELQSELDAATERADEVAAVRAELSTEVSALETQLAERTSELNAAMGDLAGAQDRADDALADLRAAENVQARMEGEISDLRNELSGRTEEVETLNTRLRDLQTRYESAQAEIAELTEKLASRPPRQPPMNDESTTAPIEPESEPKPEVVNKPELPLEIESSKALFSSAVSITLSHTGEAALTMDAAVSGQEAAGMGSREVVIRPGEEVRLGVRGDDWKLRSGQTLTLTHADYEPLIYEIP